MVKSMLYRLKLSMSGGPLYCIEETLYYEVHTVQAEPVHVWRGLALYRGGPCTMRSTLYRLNLSMSGGALYCIEGSMYNEVHTVQVEVVHVWRGFVLYRGVPVQ